MRRGVLAAGLLIGLVLCAPLRADIAKIGRHAKTNGLVAVGTQGAEGVTTCQTHTYYRTCSTGAVPLAVTTDGAARGIFAASAFGDASGRAMCTYYPEGEQTCVEHASALALSASGRATGLVAVSAVGPAGGAHESMCGSDGGSCTEAGLAAVSGAGPTYGLVSVSVLGDALGSDRRLDDRAGFCCHQIGHAVVAVSGTGTARGDVAISALGTTEGWDRCEGANSCTHTDPVIAASPTGVSVCPVDDSATC